MRFRKKPVVIEAELFDGSFERAQAIVAWSGGAITADNGDGTLSIKTLEGTMKALLGNATQTKNSQGADMSTPEPRGKMLPDAPMTLYRAASGHVFWGINWGESSILDVRLNVTRFKCDCEQIEPGPHVPPKPSRGGWLPASPPLSADERQEYRIAALEAELAQARAEADRNMELLKACEHIAEGDEGWESLATLCPSAMSVAALRREFSIARAEAAEAKDTNRKYRLLIDETETARTECRQKAQAAEAERDRLRAAISIVRSYLGPAPIWDGTREIIDAALAPQAEKPQ